jgi:hypothetical protein
VHFDLGIRVHTICIGDLLPRRLPICGVFLFKVLPLPNSCEVATEKKDREQDERGDDTFPERVGGIQQCESEQDNKTNYQVPNYSSSQKSGFSCFSSFLPLLSFDLGGAQHAEEIIAPPFLSASY